VLVRRVLQHRAKSLKNRRVRVEARGLHGLLPCRWDLCSRTLFILRSRDFYFNYNRILLCRYNRCIFRESGRWKNGRAWPINFVGIYSLTILCSSVIFLLLSNSNEAAVRPFAHKKCIHKIINCTSVQPVV